MNNLIVETGDAFSSLLEKAANNDVEGFKRLIECDPSSIDEIGLWYLRQKGSKQMVYEHRTALMVAAMYGSIDVVKLIVSLSIVDVNRSCGLDKSTALHCAASGGSMIAVETVELLLKAGADPNLVDANGSRPIDVIVVPPKHHHVKSALEDLLAVNRPFFERNLLVSTATSSSNSSPHIGHLSSASESPPSSMIPKFDDHSCSSVLEKKEYPLDPSFPDIKNSIYATDEFRMYSFKVRPCSRAYSHDWTECPFVHPGENARRRDPRKYHYSCAPCPDFRKGACRRGDMCEYAHGVFESWLHPAQYRTRMCKDGTSCSRRVCFFAHAVEELRPLYLSTGGPSPRSCNSAASTMEIAASMNFLPGSPSSVMSPSAFTPPMSPPGNGISHPSMGWNPQDVPTLRLPGSNLHCSRLRSSLHARDIFLEDLDFELQQQQLLSLSTNSHSLNCSGRSKTLNPSNLDDLFLAEGSSPRYAADQGLAASAVFSPTHRSAVLNQFQQQQTMLSPINTSFSPKSNDHTFLQASLGVTSPPGRMSPRNTEPISPLSSRGSVFAHRDHQLHQFRSLSSRELGSSAAALVGSPVHSWSAWGSSNGEPDWSVEPRRELGKLRRSSSFELGSNGEEPDLSWVQSLVKESPTDIIEKLTMPAFKPDDDAPM
ncbi:hypothetical protein Dimus_029699 [Dionaea muscipula]